MHPFPESQSSFLIPLLRHVSPSGSSGKELRAWGPMTRKEFLREVTVCWAEKILYQGIAEHLEAGKSASVSSFVFSSWGFLSQRWMERGHGGLPDHYK